MHAHMLEHHPELILHEDELVLPVDDDPELPQAEPLPHGQPPPPQHNPAEPVQDRTIMVARRNAVPLSELMEARFKALMRSPESDPRIAFGEVEWALMKAINDSDMSIGTADELLAALSHLLPDLDCKAKLHQRVHELLSAKDLELKPVEVSFWNGDLDRRDDPDATWTQTIYMVDPVAVVKQMFGESVWKLAPAPEKAVYTDDVTTGEWYIRTADGLGSKTLLFSLDGMRDKTWQSGTCIYPWYIMSNHHSRRGRMRPGNVRYHALVSTFDKVKHRANAASNAQLDRASEAYTYACYDACFAPLEEVAGGIEMPDLAGTLHDVSSQTECHNLDHPEASILGCTKADRCDCCVCPRGRFSKWGETYKRRDVEASRSLVTALRDAQAEARAAQGRAAKSAAIARRTTAEDRLQVDGLHNRTS